jgi:hypothetical protein
MVESAVSGDAPACSEYRRQNGGITLTFLGTLQSASQVTGPYSDVPGNPQGTFTIPTASLGAQSYFRTVTRPEN